MYQYSFSNVNLNINLGKAIGLNPTSFDVEGYKAGEDLLTIARKAPIAVTDFSAYGSMVVSMQRNLSVDVSFTLLQNSLENKYLQDYANYFQGLAHRGTELVKPITVNLTDNMGKDTAYCTGGVILAIPAVTRGLTVSTVTWVLSFEKGIIHREHGGIHIDGTGDLEVQNQTSGQFI